MSDRTAAIDAFLNGTAWQEWERTPLAGDASARRYFRISRSGETAILMDAPPENGEDTKPFVQIADLLINAGFAAPQTLAHDPDAGLLLLSDLGPTDFAKWVTKHPTEQHKPYQAAADVLLQLESIPPPENLKTMTPKVGAEMVGIACTHYAGATESDLCAAMETALEEFAPDPTTLALRDFHAENLIWRPQQDGIAQVGLLDFQDAFIAPAGYDLASLLRDARRDVAPDVVEDLITYYAQRTKTGAGFHIRLACLGAQRNLRILGVFARLAKEKNKPRYLAFMPRVWDHVMHDLAHAELRTLRQAVLDTIPPPTPDHLESLTK